MKGKRNHVQKPAESLPRHDGITKSQKSRKGTKAWRKNVQIDEITRGLEKVRDQKIQGGIIPERSNEELFSVDVRGDRSTLKRERLGKTLRSDEILALKSSIKPISGLVHKNSLLGSGIVHKKIKGSLPPSELARLRRIVNRAPHASTGASAASASKNTIPGEYDMWSSSEPSQSASEWVSVTKSKKPPSTYGQGPMTLTTDGSVLPAIEVAEVGQSYNPPLVEWNDLIARKAVVQMRLDSAQQQQNVKSRAAQGIDERFEAEVASDDEHLSVSLPEVDDNHADLFKKPDPRATAKTQAQRNKDSRKKQQIALETAIRAQKAQRKALSSLGSLIESNLELSDEQKQGLVTEVRKNSKVRKHKYGKHQIPQDPLEIQLSDELAESLRTLKPEGNLFKDRFISLVKRGIVEARIPQSKRRRYALLSKEKYSHKFDQGRPFMA